LRAWCEEWLARAAPLWPREEHLAEDLSATWVLGLPTLPDTTPITEQLSWVEQVARQVLPAQIDGRTQLQLASIERLRAQLALPHPPAWGSTAVDGLLCLRATPINLAVRCVH